MKSRQHSKTVRFTSMSRKKTTTRRLLMAELLEQRIVLDASMVKDINSEPISDSSSPVLMVEMGNKLYFTAADVVSGRELWTSDGTNPGTKRVKDIWPGSGASTPEELTVIGDTLFFRATDESHGTELWKSDGTEAGTTRVKDIQIGTGGSGPKNLLNVGGTLFFSANDGTSGYELWKSDGSEGGTMRVSDIFPGADSSDPQRLTDLEGVLYFAANDGESGIELWKSGGTEATTVRVRDIHSGPNSSGPNRLTAVGSTLFFTANDGATGHELWKSDGTESGTILVKDIRAGNNPGSSAFLLTNVDGTLFFNGFDGGVHGSEIWKSDGTEVGTMMIKDIRPGYPSSNPLFLTNVNGTLYFSADVFLGISTTADRELWKSDGTEAGTVQLTNLAPFDLFWGSFGPQSLRQVGDTLYFAAFGPDSFNLWQSDGTQAGTIPTYDILPYLFGLVESEFSQPLSPPVSNRFFFPGTDLVHGYELWAVPIPGQSQIVGSFAYHKNSSFSESGNNVPAALDTVKQLAKEGELPQTLSFQNVINSSRGINGIVFDIDPLPRGLTVDDFEFQVSPFGIFDQSQHPPQSWESAPVPTRIALDSGGPSRVVIEWDDNAISNRWLRVSIKANLNTGLSSPATYYLGHLAGETTGPSNGYYTVSFADITAIRSSVGQTVNVGSILDVDKSGAVTMADIATVRSHIGTQLTNIVIPARSQGGQAPRSIPLGGLHGGSPGVVSQRDSSTLDSHSNWHSADSFSRLSPVPLLTALENMGQSNTVSGRWTQGEHKQIFGLQSTQTLRDNRPTIGFGLNSMQNRMNDLALLIMVEESSVGDSLHSCTGDLTQPISSLFLARERIDQVLE